MIFNSGVNEAQVFSYRHVETWEAVADVVDSALSDYYQKCDDIFEVIERNSWNLVVPVVFYSLGCDWWATVFSGHQTFFYYRWERSECSGKTSKSMIMIKPPLLARSILTKVKKIGGTFKKITYATFCVKRMWGFLTV